MTQKMFACVECGDAYAPYYPEDYNDQEEYYCGMCIYRKDLRKEKEEDIFNDISRELCSKCKNKEYKLDRFREKEDYKIYYQDLHLMKKYFCERCLFLIDCKLHELSWWDSDSNSDGPGSSDAEYPWS